MKHVPQHRDRILMKALLLSVVCLLTLILVGVDSAAATSGSVELRFDSPSQITVLVFGTLEGSDASDMREQIDQAGDNDGTVTPDEVTTFEDQAKAFMSQFGNDEDRSSSEAGGSFTIDGKAPDKFEFSDFDLSKAEGATTSTQPVDIHLVLKILFVVEAAARHTVHFEGSTDDSSSNQGGPFNFELKSAVLKAPSGYGIESATGLPNGASVSSDKKSINFGNEFQNAGSVDIVFAKGAAKSPTAGTLLTLTILVGVAVVSRRTD